MEQSLFLSQICQYPLTNNYSQLWENLIMTHQLSSCGHQEAFIKVHLKADICHCNALAFQHNASLGNENNKSSSHFTEPMTANVALGLSFINNHTLFWTNVKETDMQFIWIMRAVGKGQHSSLTLTPQAWEEIFYAGGWQLFNQKFWKWQEKQPLSQFLTQLND